MRNFRATTLQDASDLPWVYELPPIPTAIPVWGVNIIPTPVYASYAKDDSGFEQPVGEPLYYEWSALLDPADTPLPSWIAEVVEEPTPISEPPSSSAETGLLTKLKSAIGL
jgi:hypothetical protein